MALVKNWFQGFVDTNKNILKGTYRKGKASLKKNKNQT